MKKLPGVVVSEAVGIMYQGKPLDVYMDGRPLNISSNELNAFLEGMPANSIERIEVITHPGAEFPATSGGAIMNIITSKTSKITLPRCIMVVIDLQIMKNTEIDSIILLP